jgi:hypothetical protein
MDGARILLLHEYNRHEKEEEEAGREKKYPLLLVLPIGMRMRNIYTYF